MNRRIYAPRNVLTVGEVSASTVEELGNYVRTDREEFDMAISFVPPEVESATWSPEKLKHDIQESYEALKEDGWWARFFSNHDKPRQVSLYGDDGQYWEVSAKCLAVFLHSLPGTPFVYQGEEIGMTDVKFVAIEDYNDLGTQNQYRQNLLAGMTPEEALAQAQRESRDNARTPMQWDGSANGGFTTGTPWLKVNPNTKKINVEAQRQDAYSIYQCYRRLIALRKTSSALTHGEMTFLDTGDKELIAFTRSTPEETLLTFHNFSRQEHTIPDGLLDGAGEALMSSYDREGGYRGPVLRAYESVIFRMKE